MSDRTSSYKLEAIEFQLAEAAKLIEAMLPFLNQKAKESGDVAGLQMNVRHFLCLPMVVRCRTKQSPLENAA